MSAAHVKNATMRNQHQDRGREYELPQNGSLAGSGGRSSSRLIWTCWPSSPHCGPGSVSLVSQHSDTPRPTRCSRAGHPPAPAMAGLRWSGPHFAHTDARCWNLEDQLYFSCMTAKVILKTSYMKTKHRPSETKTKVKTRPKTHKEKKKRKILITFIQFTLYCLLWKQWEAVFFFFFFILLYSFCCLWADSFVVNNN